MYQNPESTQTKGGSNATQEFLYAGILFCGECGKRFYLHRGKTVKPENNNFQCGGFQSRTTECTAHYIRESILDTNILHNLQTVTAFARDNPDELLCDGNTER